MDIKHFEKQMLDSLNNNGHIKHVLPKESCDDISRELLYKIS